MVLQQRKTDDENEKGWQYSHSYESGFHFPQSHGDKLRRRRWHRKIVCKTGSPSISLFDVHVSGSCVNGYEMKSLHPLQGMLN